MSVKAISTAFLLLLLLHHMNARPWENQQENTPYTGTFVPHLVRELDSFAAGLLSQPQVPLVGAGAAIAYLGYAGAILLTEETKLPAWANILIEESKPPALAARSLSPNVTEDIFNSVASGLVQDTLLRTESAVALRRAGGRALQHGATVLRRSLNAFSRAVAAIFSALSTGQRALQTNCVAEKLCRIGQMTGMRWPIVGVLLRSLDSADMDQYAQALIDGTTIGDCTTIYPACPE